MTMPQMIVDQVARDGEAERTDIADRAGLFIFVQACVGFLNDILAVGRMPQPPLDEPLEHRPEVGMADWVARQDWRLLCHGRRPRWRSDGMVIYRSLFGVRCRRNDC